MTAHKFLLDTNIISELMRNPQGTITERIAQEGESSICTSIIVASELYFGAAKKFQQTGSRRLLERVKLVLSAIDILPLEQPVEHHYAEIRSYLEKKGTLIGPNDLLIAAQAKANELIVVTANFNEFNRVPGLMVDQWI